VEPDGFVDPRTDAIAIFMSSGENQQRIPLFCKSS
jgi:hypothetical protein